MNESMAERRERLMGPNVPTFYRNPVHLVRGEGVWLWDDQGRRYLDCYNNVAHVGHCHPAVVEAISVQASTLNTHTRYYHDLVLDYIDRLTATLGHDLSQAIMVCTGSEANDLALRMAQAVTGKTGIIATDNTYHGNTAAVSQLSTRRPPIGGRAPNVRLVPAPDTTAPLGGSLAAQSQAFAAGVEKAIHELEQSGYGFSGLMLCPVFANEGLLSPVKGFLDPTVEVVRRAGGLILCDEVQPGFGRVGSDFWGHDALGFAPDVVTIGKPMANGHPVGACIARPDVMAAFRNAFGYFNTFGGNPVSAAACLAVLDVIERENLQRKGAETSAFLLNLLKKLDHPRITNARSAGMFFGLEFGGDGAADFTADLVEKMVERGFLMNRIGRGANVLKVRPPMVFGTEHATMLADALADALAS